MSDNVLLFDIKASIHRMFGTLSEQDRCDLIQSAEPLGHDGPTAVVCVAALFSGTVDIMWAFTAIEEALRDLYGISVLLKQMYSCDISPHARKFIRANHSPLYMFTSIEAMLSADKVYDEISGWRTC